MIMQPPTRRRLRVFATDPGDSSRLQTSFVNTATVEVPWENNLRPGPVGEYVEVVDVDPASGAAYDPVDLGHEYLLGQDGHAPSEGNPQFHQQMVYAVAMRTIRNFEVALGRRVLWAERRLQRQSPGAPFVPAPDGGYVQRLRIYPHAMREENAYYSPAKKSLLFGYFPTTTGNNKRRTVFTCLSHDIVAHETTHAVLDGLHPHYQENTNPDVLAFHEAFADIVAIFQHFTLPELLRFEIARLRGDLTQASMLSDLARQFGQSLHNGRALRRALDRSDPKIKRPDDPTSDEDDAPPLKQYDDAQEPHERGAILVAAVFEAFVAIYQRRTDDLMRLASGGTGVLRPGAIPTDLVARLAQHRGRHGTAGADDMHARAGLHGAGRSDVRRLSARGRHIGCGPRARSWRRLPRRLRRGVQCPRHLSARHLLGRTGRAVLAAAGWIGAAIRAG